MSADYWMLGLWLPLVLASALIATRLAIAYGLRAQLIDQPGGRRLHRQPTVRGAGVGIMLVLIVGLIALALVRADEPVPLYLLAAALALVAAVGWWDDHRPLPARWRLLTHLAAVLLLIWPLLGDARWATVGAFVVALIWLINAYNFIDGSDAFASGHAAWISACCGIAGAAAGDLLIAASCGLICACSSGFLYFNWPPARAFLGDVASGSLGLALGASVVWALQRATVDPLLPILLMSGVVLDASLTLLSRVVGGRRWYQAHRSHLYQWLLRSGWSARSVLALYLLWSALAGASLWLLPEQAVPRLLGAGAVLIVGAGLWVLGRQRILQTMRRDLHV